MDSRNLTAAEMEADKLGNELAIRLGLKQNKRLMKLWGGYPVWKTPAGEDKTGLGLFRLCNTVGVDKEV